MIMSCDPSSFSSDSLMLQHSVGKLTERGGELLHTDPVQQRFPCQCELDGGRGSIIIMFPSQIEDSYKNPRHRRYPSERFQEEEPAQTGKFEVILVFIIRIVNCIKRFLKGRFRTIYG